MLLNVYKRALKVGGAEMETRYYPKVFGNSTALRKNVLRICASTAMGHAVVSKVLCDHRVVESLTKMGIVATGIVLRLETRLGRKLTRSRAQQLACAYLRPRVEVSSNHVSIEVLRVRA